MAPKGTKPVASNRKARHDYDVIDVVECGIALRGSEVKSIRDSKVQLRESYARVRDGEMWLFGMHVAPWPFTSGFDAPDPDRPRKLLLHRRQIDELADRTAREALTLVPLAVYFKEGKAKVELALARGRKKWDKRAAIAERDASREAARAIARGRRGE